MERDIHARARPTRESQAAALYAAACSADDSCSDVVSTALAGPAPDYGFDWLTFGAVRNAGLTAPLPSRSVAPGAYDSTTWGGNVRDGFTDEEHHLPGAKYWIPTMDEWMKAVYYDPNKNGEDQGGWWIYPNGSDTSLISGFPDEGGQTSGGIHSDGYPDEWNIPLGAYTDVVSPWGLWDASGGTMEYLEDFYYLGTEAVNRYSMGSSAGYDGYQYLDQAGAAGGVPPDTSYPYTGFRIVSAIPGPWTGFVIGTALLGRIMRRRDR